MGQTQSYDPRKPQFDFPDIVKCTIASYLPVRDALTLRYLSRAWAAALWSRAYWTSVHLGLGSTLQDLNKCSDLIGAYVRILQDRGGWCRMLRLRVSSKDWTNVFDVSALGMSRVRIPKAKESLFDVTMELFFNIPMGADRMGGSSFALLIYQLGEDGKAVFIDDFPGHLYGGKLGFSDMDGTWSLRVENVSLQSNTEYCVVIQVGLNDGLVVPTPPPPAWAFVLLPPHHFDRFFGALSSRVVQSLALVKEFQKFKMDFVIGMEEPETEQGFLLIE